MRYTFSIILFVMLILLLMFGCSNPQTPSQRWKQEEKDHGIINGFNYDRFYVVTIDGCEYVVYHGSQKGCIIHKQNCKNHIGVNIYADDFIYTDDKIN